MITPRCALPRRGFALLFVLWTVTGLTVIAAVSAAVARADMERMERRASYVRGWWMARSCLAQLQSEAEVK